MLGQGWYQGYADGYPVRWKCENCSIFRFQMNIELEGGKQISVVSDPSWKGMDGPVLFNNIYNGEIYDARRELPGWDKTGFDDSQWVVCSAGQRTRRDPVGTAHAGHPGRRYDHSTRDDESSTRRLCIRYGTKFQRMDRTACARTTRSEGPDSACGTALREWHTEYREPA